MGLETGVDLILDGLGLQQLGMGPILSTRPVISDKSPGPSALQKRMPKTPPSIY